MAWFGEAVQEESQMIGRQNLRTKKGRHALEKSEGEFSVLTEASIRTTCWLQPALEQHADFSQLREAHP